MMTRLATDTFGVGSVGVAVWKHVGLQLDGTYLVRSRAKRPSGTNSGDVAVWKHVDLLLDGTFPVFPKQHRHRTSDSRKLLRTSHRKFQ